MALVDVIAVTYGKINTRCRQVFTTVGSKQKREYLKQRFPQLDDAHFANSRDASFEWDVMRATNGRGVNVVLNSLAEEKLQASLRLLAPHGQFLEIGKLTCRTTTSSVSRVVAWLSLH